jgi:hypothetical protein
MYFSGIKWIFILAALLGTPPAFAHTVSFMVVETGLRQEGPAMESTNRWENGLMDVFFDAGHIVSNALVLRIDRKPTTDLPDEARRDFEEAREGGVDFFILAFLDYRSQNESEQNDPSHPDPTPRRVSLRIFRVNPYQFIFEEGYSEGNTSPGGDELTRAKNAARLILPHLRNR